MTKAGLGFLLGFREKKMKVKGVFWGFRVYRGYID